ncbi:unnamed protein product [Brassica rapa subsp. narinosa]
MSQKLKTHYRSLSPLSKENYCTSDASLQFVFFLFEDITIDNNN